VKNPTSRNRKLARKSPDGESRVVRRDVMSAEKRSALMGRIRGKNTGPEKTFAKVLETLGVVYESHAADLPGRPDFALRGLRIAIFIDGDFWHGWRFPTWKHKLAPFWAAKIEGNRARDRRNFAKLRRGGWRVLRIWEHELERSIDKVMERTKIALDLTEAPGFRRP